MSSNITVTPGLGATVSTDEITTLNGVTVTAQQAQRIKQTFGVAGQATDVSVSNPLPVTSVVTSLPALAAGSNVIGAITQSGTWNVGTVTTVTSLSQFGGAAINLGAGTVGTGTLRITQASDSPLVTATGAIADAAWTTGSGTVISLLKAVAGAAISTASSPVTIDQTTPGTTNGVVSTPVSTAYALIPAPSTYRVPTSGATTNAASIKASAGAVKGIQGVNHAAVTVYIHLYDMNGSPTVGTSTIRKTQEVPASAAFALDYGTGIGFATGISISMTKGSSADNDTTVLASGDITSLNVDYH